jgi:hypothetical protein
MFRQALFLAVVICGWLASLATCFAELPRVLVASGASGFVLEGSGARFTPWGFNYGRPDKLLEDFWEADWEGVEADFREMKELGANVVRVHLQFGKFMEAADRPNEAALGQLKKLLKLAERTGLYLDVTGLGCYRKADVPAWYDALGDRARWAAQAAFWEAVARTCGDSSAVFCYDLMNEPVASGPRKAGEWYSGKTLGGFDFVQFVALNPERRPREDVAVEWIRALTAAIRKHDRRTPITVGLLPWSEKWKFLSGFLPEKAAAELSFISEHIYPEGGKVDEALTGLKKYAGWKPVVVEETFPLSCGVEDLEKFLLESRGAACGWIGHYDGRTTADFDALRDQRTMTIADALMAEWLKLFKRLGPEMVKR